MSIWTGLNSINSSLACKKLKSIITVASTRLATRMALWSRYCMQNSPHIGTKNAIPIINNIMPVDASPVASGMAMLTPQKAGSRSATIWAIKPTMIRTHTRDTLEIVVFIIELVCFTL